MRCAMPLLLLSSCESPFTKIVPPSRVVAAKAEGCNALTALPTVPLMISRTFAAPTPPLRYTFCPLKTPGTAAPVPLSVFCAMINPPSIVTGPVSRLSPVRMIWPPLFCVVVFVKPVARICALMVVLTWL